MDRLNCIFGRRSIRKFKAKPVETEKVELLLKAAMAAPSAHNSQPWHFITVTEQRTRKKIADFHPYAKMLNQAPLCICVCGEPVTSTGKERPFWVQDCSAAMENILLAATSLGLGGVWVGLYPSANLVSKIKEVLNLPEHITPLGLAVLGYPDQEKSAGTKYDESKIHHEQYGGEVSRCPTE